MLDERLDGTLLGPAAQMSLAASPRNGITVLLLQPGHHATRRKLAFATDTGSGNGYDYGEDYDSSYYALGDGVAYVYPAIPTPAPTPR